MPMPGKKLLAYWIYGATVLALYGAGGFGGWWRNLIRFEGTRWIGYGVLGIAMFAIALKVIVRVSPFAVRKEIEEDQNVALALVIASIFVGLAIIVAAAIQG